MHRSLVQFRLVFLTAAALTATAPALAQQYDPEFRNTLRELNADIDYGDLYRQQPAPEAAPGVNNPPAAGRTYNDPGQTRGSAVDQDIDAVRSTERGLPERQLIDTVRDADRISQ